MMCCNVAFLLYPIIQCDLPLREGPIAIRGRGCSMASGAGGWPMPLEGEGPIAMRGRGVPSAIGEGGWPIAIAG